MTTELNAIAFKAQTHPKHRFRNMFGTLKVDALYRVWVHLNKQSAAGIDGVDATQYEADLSTNIHRLAHKLKSNHFRVGDVKRVYIPKSNGKQRPLGLPTIEDKLVQQGVADILLSIWEQDFVRNSYGYRPNKSAHQAIQSLQLNLQYRGYGYIVEADIKGFFDNMDHEWLMRMLRNRSFQTVIPHLEAPQYPVLKRTNGATECHSQLITLKTNLKPNVHTEPLLNGQRLLKIMSPAI